MWWAGDRLDAYVGTRQAALCAGGRLLHNERVATGDEAVELLHGWLQGRRPRLRIWLSGALCRPFLLHGPAQFRGAAELDAAAAMLARRVLDGAVARFWLAPVQRGAPSCLGAAAAEDRLAALEDRLAPRSRGRVGIGPWWGAGPRLLQASARGAASAVIVHDCDSLTWLAGTDRAWIDVRSAAPIDDHATVEATVQRWRLSTELALDAAVHIGLAPAPDAVPGGAPGTLPLAPLVRIRSPQFGG